MDFDAFEGLIQMIVPLVVCCLPIVLAVGAILVVLVLFGRSKPKAKAEPKKASPPKAAAVVEPKPAIEEKPKAAAVPGLTSCGSCGAENPADNAFCEYCGASLAEE